jgi:transcriptional regulator with XRE-family HTH domain
MSDTMIEGSHWSEDRAELRKQRKALGMSQADLARKAGVSRSLVRDVEIGRIKLRDRLSHALWEAIALLRNERIQLKDLIPPDGPDERLEWTKKWAEDLAKFRREYGELLDLMRRNAALEAEVAMLRSGFGELRTEYARHFEQMEAELATMRGVATKQGDKILAENGIDVRSEDKRG